MVGLLFNHYYGFYADQFLYWSNFMIELQLMPN